MDADRINMGFITEEEAQKKIQERQGSSGGGFDINNITPEMASMAQLTLSPKAAAMVKSAYDIQQSSKEEEDVETMTGADSKVVASVKSGLRSVDSASKILFGNLFPEEGKAKTTAKGKLALFGATSDLLPFGGRSSGGKADLTPWGRDIEKDLFNAADAILRIRTGAAAPEAEIRRYMQQFAPIPSDTAEVKAKKLRDIKAELSDVLSGMGQADKDPLGLGI